MALPPMLIIFIALVIFFTVHLKFGNKGYRKKMDTYIEAEEEVNQIRKKNLDETYFVKPDLNRLPIIEYNEISDVSTCQNTAIQKSKLKMARFGKQISNLELKKIYGINNLQKIIDYEEHFNMYITALNKWAEALMKEGRLAESLHVLREAALFGSDYLMTYTLLIDIYLKEGRRSEISRLKEDIQKDKFFENPALKNRVLNYVNIKFGG
ncbi:MAG: hypothetical protein LBV08_02555 [Clostridiales bacterium]|nr:hypothetical protein [Clostridiales bacterium]